MLKDKHAFMSALKQLPKKKRKRLIRCTALLLAGLSAAGTACLHDSFLTPQTPQADMPDGGISSEENVMGSGYQKYLEQKRSESDSSAENPDTDSSQKSPPSSFPNLAEGMTSELLSGFEEILSKQSDDAPFSSSERTSSETAVQKEQSSAAESDFSDEDGSFENNSSASSPADSLQDSPGIAASSRRRGVQADAAGIAGADSSENLSEQSAQADTSDPSSLPSRNRTESKTSGSSSGSTEKSSAVSASKESESSKSRQSASTSEKKSTQNAAQSEISSQTAGNSGTSSPSRSSGSSSAGSSSTQNRTPARITASSQTVKHDKNYALRKLPRRIVDPEPLEREIIDPVAGSEHKVVPDEKGDGYYAESTGRDNYYYAPPVLIDLRVYKRWNDEDDRDGIRPAEVYFTLQVRKKGTSTWEDANWDNANWGTRTRVPDADGKIRFDFIYDEANPIKAIRNNEMPDENSADRDTLWYCEFQQVLKYKDGVELEYRVLETEIPDPRLSRAHTDYTAYINDIGDDWGGAVYEGDTVVVKDPQCVTDAAESPIGSNGKTTAAPAFYLINQADDEAETGWVREAYETSYTNYHKPDRIKIDLTKIWIDRNNQDGIRPQTISLELRADGVKANNSNAGYIGPNPLIVDPGSETENEWYGVFENLYRYRHRGQVIVYTVVEKRLDPVTKDIYTLQYELPTYVDPTNDDSVTDKTESVNSGNIQISVTNEKETAVRDLEIVKTWDDENDVDKKRPDQVQVNLTAWVHGRFVQITNENKAEYLLNPDAYFFPLVLSEANNWKVTVKDLYTYENHNPENFNVDNTERILYDISEVPVEGYNRACDVSEKHSVVPDIEEHFNQQTFKSTFNLVNVRIPTKISIDLTKFWDDGGTGLHHIGDQDGYRKNVNIIFDLYADGVYTGKSCSIVTGSIGTLDAHPSNGIETMNAANQFIIDGAFDDVPAFKPSGVRIKYTVKERKDWDSKNKYTSQGFTGVDVIIPENAYDYAPLESEKVGTVYIENVHERETTEIYIEKSWSGSAPAGNIVYVLTQNGIEIARKIANASTGRVSFGVWPKFDNHGEVYDYQVTEECSIAGVSNGTPTAVANPGKYAWRVVNRYNPPGNTTITVRKNWSGADQGPAGGNIVFKIERKLDDGEGNCTSHLTGSEWSSSQTLPTDCPDGSSVVFSGLETSYTYCHRSYNSDTKKYDHSTRTGKYSYTISESVTGVSGVGTDGAKSNLKPGATCAFTNSYTPPAKDPGLIEFQVTKNWKWSGTDEEIQKMKEKFGPREIIFVLLQRDPIGGNAADKFEEVERFTTTVDEIAANPRKFEKKYPKTKNNLEYEYRIAEIMNKAPDQVDADGKVIMDSAGEPKTPTLLATTPGAKPEDTVYTYGVTFENEITQKDPPDGPPRTDYSIATGDCYVGGGTLFNAVVLRCKADPSIKTILKENGCSDTDINDIYSQMSTLWPNTSQTGRVPSHPDHWYGLPTAEHEAAVFIACRDKFFQATNPHEDGIPRTGTIISGYRQEYATYVTEMTHAMVVADYDKDSFTISETGVKSAPGYYRKQTGCKQIRDDGKGHFWGVSTPVYTLIADPTATVPIYGSPHPKYMYAYPTLMYEQLLIAIAQSADPNLDCPSYNSAGDPAGSVGSVRLVMHQK